MKRILLIMSLSAYMVAFPVTAAMNQSGTMHTTKMMSRDMMRNMSQMMLQINEMTKDMTKLMDQLQTMEREQIREMALIMEQLSRQMHVMSQHIETGNMDKAMLQEMEKNMAEIRTKLQNMEQIR